MLGDLHVVAIPGAITLLIRNIMTMSRMSHSRIFLNGEETWAGRWAGGGGETDIY